MEASEKKSHDINSTAKDVALYVIKVTPDSLKLMTEDSFHGIWALQVVRIFQKYLVGDTEETTGDEKSDDVADAKSSIGEEKEQRNILERYQVLSEDTATLQSLLKPFLEEKLL